MYIHMYCCIVIHSYMLIHIYIYIYIRMHVLVDSYYYNERNIGLRGAADCANHAAHTIIINSYYYY